MKKLNLNLFAIALVAGTIGLTSCGNDSASNDNSSATEATTEETSADATDASTTQLVLEANDQMKFDQTELRVPAGSKVTLTLNHTGKMPVTAMGHNFVLLNQRVDMEAFSTACLTAKDNEYIPVDSKDIIAHTKLIGGGESDEITFDAPEAGEYDFLCSFPGHHAMMKGKFIVE